MNLASPVFFVSGAPVRSFRNSASQRASTSTNSVTQGREAARTILRQPVKRDITEPSSCSVCASLMDTSYFSSSRLAHTSWARSKAELTRAARVSRSGTARLCPVSTTPERCPRPSLHKDLVVSLQHSEAWHLGIDGSRSKLDRLPPRPAPVSETAQPHRRTLKRYGASGRGETLFVHTI